MIEVMVALFILSIMSTAIITLSISILSANAYAKMKSQATVFAEEAIETVRSQVLSSNWQTVASKSSSGGTCYTNVSAWVTGNCLDDCSATNINSTYYRYVRLTSIGQNSVKTESVVTWTNKGKCNRMQLDTYFYDH